MISLDVPLVFETAGGPRKLLDLLDRHVPDHGVEYPRVQMWQQRAAIPGRLLPSVLFALACHGHRDLLVFFTDLL